MNYTKLSLVRCGAVIYLPHNLGGFEVSGCPDGENLAVRIVACINACAGKETEDLEYMAGKDIFTGNIFSKRVAMEKERDTYRELCGDLLESLTTVNSIAEGDWGSDEVTQSLITKAEAILGGNNGTSN